MNNRRLQIGDRVIIKEYGADYGKMCTIIEASDTNEELPVRVQLVNPHDHFKLGDTINAGLTEKWTARTNVRLCTDKELL